MGRVDELMNLSGRYGSDPDPSLTSTAAPRHRRPAAGPDGGDACQALHPASRSCQPRESARTSPAGYGRI